MATNRLATASKTSGCCLKNTPLKLGYKRTKVFIDDGYSGTDFGNRPALQEMLIAIENDEASALIVKDLSRFGRDYLRVGFYLEDFVTQGVRVIAVNDRYDSRNGPDDMMPLRNIMNERYAKEASEKIRSAYSLRGKTGTPIGSPPYGYIKSPENPKYWVVDKPAAEVVRRIFQLYASGSSISQIARTLEGEKILTPQNYWQAKGVRKAGRTSAKSPYVWSVATITHMLGQREYCGDVVNFKTYSPSFLDKKRRPNDEEDLLIFENVHEPIVDRETWNKVQRERKKKRKPREKSTFSGLLVCSDCGANLNLYFDHANPNNKYFNCSKYNKSKKICSTSHHIRTDFLEQIVLQEVQRMIRYATKHKEHFIENVMNKRVHQVKNGGDEKYRQSKMAFSKRHDDLNELIANLFEDKARGVISEERFQKIATKFEAEQQQEVSDRLEQLKDQEDVLLLKEVSPEKFLLLAKNHQDTLVISREVAFDLFEKIEVFHAETMDGGRVRTIKIHYTHIGYCPIPRMADLKVEPLVVYPRKGVSLRYLPFDIYEEMRSAT